MLLSRRADLLYMGMTGITLTDLQALRSATTHVVARSRAFRMELNSYSREIGAVPEETYGRLLVALNAANEAMARVEAVGLDLLRDAPHGETA